MFSCFQASFIFVFALRIVYSFYLSNDMLAVVFTYAMSLIHSKCEKMRFGVSSQPRAYLAFLSNFYGDLSCIVIQCISFTLSLMCSVGCYCFVRSEYDFNILFSNHFYCSALQFSGRVYGLFSVVS